MHESASRLARGRQHHASRTGAPVAAFERSGNLLFLSDHIGQINSKPWIGKLWGNLTTAKGKEAARAVASDI